MFLDQEGMNNSMSDLIAMPIIQECFTSEQLEQEKFEEPVEILVKLAKEGEIDPWNIDIVEITDRFLEHIEEMERMDLQINIVEFDPDVHGEQVEKLWIKAFAYNEARNAPQLVMEKKYAVHDGLFFVAIADDLVIGTIIAGYDGHRGWIYSMAVHTDHRHRGIGSALLSYAETKLAARGCVKINLQIMGDNKDVQRFYETNGYTVENRISMGKELPENL